MKIVFLRKKTNFRKKALDPVHTAHYERGELNYCIKNFLSVNSMR